MEFGPKYYHRQWWNAMPISHPAWCNFTDPGRKWSWDQMAGPMIMLILDSTNSVLCRCNTLTEETQYMYAIK